MCVMAVHKYRDVEAKQLSHCRECRIHSTWDPAWRQDVWWTQGDLTQSHLQRRCSGT